MSVTLRQGCYHRWLKPNANAEILLPPAYVVRREGNSFTLFVSPHRGGGVSGPAGGGGGSGPAGGGSGPADRRGQVQLGGGGSGPPDRGGGGPAGGGQVQPGGGQVQLTGGGSGPADGGGVRSSWGGGADLASGGGVRSSWGGGGSASCALLRAVRLLRSRRRTFLLTLNSQQKKLRSKLFFDHQNRR